MKNFGSIIASALLSFGLVACGGGGKEPTCENAAANVVKIAQAEMEKELAKMPPEQQTMVKEMMAKNLTVEAFTAQCKERTPSKESLTCAINAKSVEDLQKCDLQNPAGGAPAATPPTGGEGAAAPTGGEGAAPAAGEGAAPAAGEGAAPAAGEGAAPAAGEGTAPAAGEGAAPAAGEGAAKEGN